MSTLYFVSPTGNAPLNDPSLRGLADQHHWISLGGVAVYGLVHVKLKAHPLDLVDALTALGVLVMSSTHESTPVPAEVAAALSSYGVTATDDTFACATKMYAVCGIKQFRPHRY